MIELEAPDVSETKRAKARRRLEALEHYTDDPIDVRATIRHTHGGHGARPYVVDAHLAVDGRVLAAHVSGPDPVDAAAQAADRLRRQLRRVVGADIARRYDPRALGEALTDLALDPLPARVPEPPEEREIVRRHTYSDHPQSTYEAISHLIDDDERFRLFVHVRTGEDVVVHRRGEAIRIGLLHPQGSPLADETDNIVVAEPSRYSRPVTLAQARAEEDLLNHAFLYFIDAGDLRGKVLYLRRDGDYGLVEPR